MALRTVLKRRRRRRKYKKKYSLEEAIKRAKKLLPIMVPSLDLELNYYVDAVEPQSFEVLSSLGVSGEAREHLLGYIKKAISIGLRLGGETFSNELEALKDEYVLRGFDREVLDRLDEAIFEKIEVRKSVYIEVVRGVYEGMKYVFVNTLKHLLYLAYKFVKARPPAELLKLIYSFLIGDVVGGAVEAVRATPSFKLITAPSKPSPSVVASVSPSVGVRKSP